MSVTLSSSDLRALERGIELLVSPLDHADLDGWRAAVNRHLRPLLGADSVGFLLPTTDAVPFYSDEHDPEEINRYPEIVPPPAAGGRPAWEACVDMGVGTLEMVYGEALPRYLASDYYNEFAAPGRAHDTLAATVAVEGGTPAIASLQLWHERPDGRRFGEREVALLRLLFPAFRAGVASAARWGAHRTDLVQMLDALHQPAVVGGLDGTVLHVTRALGRALDADPQRETVWDAVRTMLHTLGGVGTRACTEGTGPLQRRVRTGAGPRWRS